MLLSKTKVKYKYGKSPFRFQHPVKDRGRDRISEWVGFFASQCKFHSHVTKMQKNAITHVASMLTQQL